MTGGESLHACLSSRTCFEVMGNLKWALKKPDRVSWSWERITWDDCSRLLWIRQHTDLDPRYGQQREPLNNWASYLATREDTRHLKCGRFAELGGNGSRCQHGKGILNESFSKQRRTPPSDWTPPSKGKALREMEEEGSLEPNNILAKVSFFFARF